MHPRTVILDCDQRAELIHTRSRDSRPYLRERAAAILKIADGMTPYGSLGRAWPRLANPIPSTIGSIGTNVTASLV